MSRKKTWAEQCAEAEAADAAQAERNAAQAECNHWTCEVTEWWFSGKPRTMKCCDCGAENWIEEEA